MPGVVGQTTPPLSPRDETATPKHRRKPSHHASKSSRPATLSRRSTPQYITKLGAGGRREKESRECEAQVEEGESFLNYCTYCEKQIDSSSTSHLYCSEPCRQRDLSSSNRSSHHSYTSSGSSLHIPFSSYTAKSYTSPPRSPYNIFSFADGPDIVPRASPTVPRPRSYYGSEPFSTPSVQGQYAVSGSLAPGCPDGPSGLGESGSSHALASLRELSSALQSSHISSRSGRSRDYERKVSEKEKRGRLGSGSRSGNSRSSSDDESPTRRPSEPQLSKSASGVWSYMPFASGASKAPAADISRTYSTPSMLQQQDTPKGSTKSRVGSGSGSSSNYALATPTNPTDVYGLGLNRNPGMDRPLPPRSGGYGHRPKSIDLVTPFSGPDS